MKSFDYLGSKFLGIVCFLLVGSYVLFFNSCVSTNKAFKSSPVVARNITLDPIKADIRVNESQKLNGESTLTYFLFFKLGMNKYFADGIQYSTDVAGGFNPMVTLRANIMNPIRSSAAYNALRDTDYDVLVHPTYETRRENYLFLVRKYSVKVSGYGGKYYNFRTEPQILVILNNGQELLFSVSQQELESVVQQIQSAPIEQPLIQPESVVQPIVEPELVAQPVTQPEPVVQPVIQPDPVVQPVTQPEPAVQPATQLEPVVQPVIQPEPVVLPVTQLEPVTQPVIQHEPVVQPATQPEPVVQPDVHPEPVVQPIRQPEPIVHSSSNTTFTPRQGTEYRIQIISQSFYTPISNLPARFRVENLIVEKYSETDFRYVVPASSWRNANEILNRLTEMGLQAWIAVYENGERVRPPLGRPEIIESNN